MSIITSIALALRKSSNNHKKKKNLQLTFQNDYLKNQ